MAVGRHARIVLAARVVLAAAGVAAIASACIGGELGTATAQASLLTDVHLSPATPVAVRHLMFSSTGATDVNMTTMTISVSRLRDDNIREVAPGVTVSVRPDDRSVIYSSSGHPVDPLPGAVLSFARGCSAGCQGGVMVVVRADPSSTASEDLRIFSEIRLSAPSQDRRSLEATPAIVEDAARRFDGSAATAGGMAIDTIEVGATAALASAQVRIHAAEAALGSSRVYPLVGSLTVVGVGDAETHAALSAPGAAALGSLLFDEQHNGINLASEGNPTDLDWLSRCPPTGDCDLSFQLTFSGPSLVSTARVNGAVAENASPSIPAAFHLELQATAILEAFDGRTLDPAGVTVTMETR